MSETNNRIAELLRDSCKSDESNNNTNGIKKQFLKNSNRVKHQKVMKKLSLKRYRSGSSSDSAITLDNVFEDDEDFVSPKSLDLAVFEDFQEIVYNFVCMFLQHEPLASSQNGKPIVEIVKRYYDYNIDQNETTDKNGFYLVKNDEQFKENQIYLQSVLNELLNGRSSKYWYCGCENLKCLIREYGIPNELRQQVWMTFIKSKIKENYDISRLLLSASAYITSATEPRGESNLRQIDLDVHRTMPHHSMFAEDSDGIEKLRKILIAYSVYVNPIVGYCQAMNFIAALLLVVFQGNEADALMGLICIIDYYFPPHYYDQQLTGVRADQLLLRDLLLNRMKHLKEKDLLTEHVVDEITNSLSLNWFLSLFHNAVPWQTRMFILDSFWLEGVKVLFRYSLALIDTALKEKTVDISPDLPAGECINLIRDKAKRCYDIVGLKKTAFGQIKIPRRKNLATRRAFYVKQLCVALTEEKNETTAQWIKRRSSEILGLRSPVMSKEARVIISSNRNSIAVGFHKNCNSIIDNDIIILDVSANNSKLFKTSNLHKNTVLIGVDDNGKKLIFCQSSSRSNSINEQGIATEFVTVNFEFVEAFYIQDLSSVLIVGRDGTISKIFLNDRENQVETITLNNRKSKISAAALDPAENLLWINTLSNENEEQLIAIDIISLDLFDIIDIGLESIHHLSCGSGLAYIGNHKADGSVAVSIITSSFTKQLIYEAGEELRDLKVFKVSIEEDFVSPSNLSLQSIITSETTIAVVLLRSGKLIVTEVNGNCIKEKRYFEINREYAKCSVIAAATKINNDFIITLVVPNLINKLINISV